MTSQPHADSYYAATRINAPSYPSLEADIEADVCVVGGGFTGIATALTLAERGYSVVVLEQNRIGWGASGRNGGQVIGGFSGVAGMYFSYYLDVASGATIVLLQASLFCVALVISALRRKAGQRLAHTHVG